MLTRRAEVADWPAVAGLIAAAIRWGVGTVISKAALEEIPPLTLFPIQLTTSLALLAILMHHQRIPLPPEGLR